MLKASESRNLTDYYTIQEELGQGRWSKVYRCEKHDKQLTSDSGSSSSSPAREKRKKKQTFAVKIIEKELIEQVRYYGYVILI